MIRVEWWDDLAPPDVPLDSPTFLFIVIHDPRWSEPLVLATSLAISARALRDLYLDRWPSTAPSCRQADARRLPRVRLRS